jgi:hypothetical protein
MQRGIDALQHAERGVDLLKDRLAEIAAEEAELSAERAEIHSYLARLRDVAVVPAQDGGK